MVSSEMGSQQRHASPWSAGRGPVIRFVLIFGLLLVAFNVFFYLYLIRTEFFGWYLHMNAEVSAAILRLFGERAYAEEGSIFAPRFAMGIARGCDALQSSAFFAIGVFASPLRVPLLRRVFPVVVGMASLLLLNIVRVLTLFYASHYSHALFKVLHIEVWQAVFIFCPLFLWILWARRVARSLRNSPDVSA